MPYNNIILNFIDYITKNIDKDNLTIFYHNINKLIIKYNPEDKKASGEYNPIDNSILINKEKIEKIEEKFHEAINDDMNMPLAMSYVWELARYEKKNPEISKMLKKFDTVLGIKIDKEDIKDQKEIPQEILDLVEQRKIARQNKDWAKSDELRDLINKKGYDIKDTANGTEVKHRGQS